MPDWLTWGIAVVGLLGGSGGIAAYLRARGQNRTDDRRALTEEQASFRQAMAAELAALRQKVNDLEKGKDAVEVQAADQGKQIAALEVRNAYQEQQIEKQAGEIAALKVQNTEQAGQIATLTTERQEYLTRLKIAETRADVLERECNDLRNENMRLRSKLPPRTEG